MPGNMSISVKLASLVLVTSLVILAGILGYNYTVSRSMIVALAETNSRNLGREVASFIASEIRPVETLVANVALALESGSLDEKELSALTLRIVLNNPSVFGSAIALEPYTQSTEQLFSSPYSYRSPSGVTTINLGGPDYLYFNMDWYLLPKELGHPTWTEPYYDTGGGNSLMMTYSAPFYRFENGKKIFAGVVTADVLLDWLHEKCSAIRLYDTGYCVVLSGRGTFLYHPKADLIMNETIFSLAEEQGDAYLWQTGRNMIEGKSDFLENQNLIDRKPGFLMFLPLSVGNWSLGLAFPKEEVLKQVTILSGKILGIGIGGFLVLTAVVIMITRRITRPLKTLSGTAMEIASGNLEAELETLESGDEVGQLSRAFSHMQVSLKAYIRDLTAATAEKERIESELRIAREIQMGILPKLFPPFPDREEFDIYAAIEPAREVGGDLYDFFFVDDHRFCFLIGDVSGKGVPAAFFMAVTRTLLKVTADSSRSPGEILEKVNNDLASDNDACMFVTLFLGIVDLADGNLDYACAGHNPPLVASVGSAQWLSVFNEPMAGALEGIPYTTGRVTLSPGDTVLLYTDGVTEAMNPDEELYSDQRLSDEIVRLSHTVDGVSGARHMVKGIMESVTGFAAGAEQSDDITLLALTFNRPLEDKA